MYWLTNNNNEKYFIREEESGDAIYYGKILNGSAILNDLIPAISFSIAVCLSI